MALLSPSIRMSFPAPLGPTINSSFPFALIIHFYTFNLGHLRFFFALSRFQYQKTGTKPEFRLGGVPGRCRGLDIPKNPGPKGHIDVNWPRGCFSP